ncbi:hypothetical protein CC78DRAFT_529465 [Lojkania enalia]|uniref:Uncharacterized protein n=1 Tax=Lojkania enalia TaxID=147567 RepID=A0A9P4N9T4_9PLEO|nr:hypothetical protein CC78DRAFT_529465 [Didymosphaeria enalia]
MAPLTIESITLVSFNEILSRYPSTVPEKLQELDTLRYDTIPSTLAKRKVDGDAYLAKSEVENLVEWKLRHGTFRPKLLGLVQSNPEHVIQSTTRDAFTKFSASDPIPALKILMDLKGIGTATASLLLSVYAPDDVPFFSDEMLRWCLWGEKGMPGGWKRVIKYNVKEYGDIVNRIKIVRTGLGVSAEDVEKVAWVLGKESVDVGAEDNKEPVNNAKEKDEETKQELDVKNAERAVSEKKGKDEKTTKKSKKRKADDAKEMGEAVRRSVRRKTKG